MNLALRCVLLTALPSLTLAQVPKMVFAHISDHHLKGQQSIVNQTQVFRDVIAHAQSQGATFCIYTGDITDDGDPDECIGYAQAFAESPIPVYPVIGNHDINRPYTIYWPDGSTTPPNVDWGDLANIGVTQESQLHSRVNYQMYIDPKIHYQFVRQQNGFRCLFIVGDSQVSNQLQADQLNNLPAFQGLNPLPFESYVIDRLTAAQSANHDFVFVCNHMPYDGSGYGPSTTMSTAVAGLKDFVFLNGHTHQFLATRKESNHVLRLTAPATGTARAYSVIRLYDGTLDSEEWVSHSDRKGNLSWQIKESRRCDINRTGTGTARVYGAPTPFVSATGSGLSSQVIEFENLEGQIPRYPIEAGVPIQFDASATTSGNAINRVEWDMGDGWRFNTPNDNTPVTHTYTAPGVHRLVMRVVTNQGSSKSARAEFEVIEPPLAAIPSTIEEVQASANQVMLCIPENELGATYVVKPSADLQEWNDGPLYFTGTGAGDCLEVTINLPPGVSSHFFTTFKKVTP